MNFETLVLLPIGLGLLGFIEPCTIGAHMLFLRSIEGAAAPARHRAVAVFAATRTVVIGLIGVGFVLLGQRLVGFQTGLWLVFGSAYLLIGLAYLADMKRLVTHRIALAPQRWKQAGNPAVMGLAFGLNIPACAAPILFALMGAAAVGGSGLSGFLAMGTFALALSLPLVPLSVAPRLARPLGQLAEWLRPRRRLLGGIFALLGIWSIWFGLFVDPADWSGL